MKPTMLKGHLEAMLLSALEASPTHGYAVVELIRVRSGGTFDLPQGTVYPALHRLEQAGLLTSAWVTPVGGRKRRLYSLTRAGAASLANRRQSWSRFSRAVDAVLGGGRTSPA